MYNQHDRLFYLSRMNTCEPVLRRLPGYLCIVGVRRWLYSSRCLGLVSHDASNTVGCVCTWIRVVYSRIRELNGFIHAEPNDNENDDQFSEKIQIPHPSRADSKRITTRTRKLQQQTESREFKLHFGIIHNKFWQVLTIINSYLNFKYTEIFFIATGCYHSAYCTGVG